MLISKILNNNVVISEEDQEEVILMGRGLAFGRKVGQEIPDELIEKKYVLSENRRQLLMELPAEVMEMSDKIISFAREKLQKKLKDTAVARVRLVPGTGIFTVNGRTLEEYDHILDTRHRQ